MKLSRLLLLSSIILFVTAFFSVGYFHFDEHFQILEFAGLKLGILQKQSLPWEYHNQMRSAIQPAMVVGMHHLLKPLGIENPFNITLLLRLLSAALSFLALFLLFKTYAKQIVDERLKKWFVFLSFFLWMLIFNSVRFSSENWSGSLFSIAFSYYFLYRKPRLPFYFIVGLFCGLSFLFRFQIAFLIAAFLGWMLFVQKEKIHYLLVLALGIGVVFSAGLLVDRWYYEEWTISAYNYVKQFFLLGNKSGFTQEPWWYYFKEAFLRAIPPFSLVYILALCLLFFFKRKDPLTWVLFPFILIHFFISHKEIRFFFPILGFLPIVIIKAFEIIQEKFDKEIVNRKVTKITAKVFFVISILLLIVVVFRPADSQVPLYKKIYADYTKPITLYYIKDNPYHRVLDIYYYKRKDLTIQEISIKEIKEKNLSNYLIVTKKTSDLDAIQRPKQKIYSSYPDWVMKFNFNNWQERSGCWYVYEVN